VKGSNGVRRAKALVRRQGPSKVEYVLLFVAHVSRYIFLPRPVPGVSGGKMVLRGQQACHVIVEYLGRVRFQAVRLQDNSHIPAVVRHILILEARA